MTAATIATMPTPAPATITTGVCPHHGADLSGGPVVWHCPHGGRFGHRVQAADLDHEVATAPPARPRVTVRAAR